MFTHPLSVLQLSPSGTEQSQMPVQLLPFPVFRSIVGSVVEVDRVGGIVEGDIAETENDVGVGAAFAVERLVDGDNDGQEKLEVGFG